VRIVTCMVLLMVASLTSCASPGSKTVDFSDASEALQLELPALSCGYDFAGLVDARPQRNVRAYRSPASLKNLQTYIEQEIRSWMPSDEIGQQSIPVHLELLRFYHEPKSTAAFFNIVFGLQVNSGPREFIRGQYSSMTWVGTEEELQAKMQRSVNAGLVELHETLEARCEQA